MKKIICFLLCILVPALCLSGCGKDANENTYDKNAKISVLDSGVLASNELYELSYNSAHNSVSMLCKSNGKVWSTCPDETTDEITTIAMRVQDTRIVKEFAYDDSSVDRVSVEKIENGVKLTYYFDELEISVPVSYTLRDDSMSISINGADICQTKTRYQLIAVQPAPMLARVSVEAENSYLFLTNGIGAIVDNKATADPVKKMTTSASNIASMEIESYVNSPDSCGCKCFGVKDGENAALCIAEDTPGAMGYNLIAGDNTSEFSRIYPTFFFADYDYFYGISVLDGLLKQVSDLYRGTVSVGFYPLSGENADYNGMAKCYRNYLIKSGYLKADKTAGSNSPYSVTYYGGVMTDVSVAGVITKKLNVMTGFDDAAEMTRKLVSDTGSTPVVRLSGYGKTGINIGEVAGGYKFSSKFGSNAARDELEKYIQSENSELYTDFGIVYYRKSGSGFTYSYSSAKTAIHHAAEISPTNVPMRDFNTGLTYRLLSRDNLFKAVDKLISFANKKNVSGVALNDLGNIYYSDYSNDTEYGVSAKMDTDTKQLIEDINKSGHKVAVSGSAFFSAGISDVVFDAPLLPAGRNIYKAEIPFSQMVFHGITPMYSTAVNTAVDIKYQIMLAASSGTGLGFSFVKDYDSSYVQSDGVKLYSMVFENNYPLVKQSLDKYEEIYKSVENSKISRYDLLDNSISKTTFENGVCIYANHSSSPQESPVGVIEGYGFVKGGETV